MSKETDTKQQETQKERCPECNSDIGHRMSCKTGVQRADAYQKGLEAKYRASKKESAENRKLVKKYRSMNMSDREISIALGINEDALAFYI